MIEKVHVSEIKVGDTVMYEGKLTTVGAKDITYDSFIGGRLFGDTYNLGTILIERVTLGNKN